MEERINAQVSVVAQLHCSSAVCLADRCSHYSQLQQLVRLNPSLAVSTCISNSQWEWRDGVMEGGTRP